MAKTIITPAYDKIRDALATGDVLLFSGKGPRSQGIKWFSRSGWSHVGMVVRIGKSVMLWESTTLSDLPELELGRATKGVQLVLLSDRLLRYDGKIAVRRLAVTRTPAMLSALESLRESLRGRPYEKNECELIKAAYEGPWGSNTEDLSSLFCREMVSEAYQAMALLEWRKSRPGYRASNEFTPADLASDAEAPLPLLKGRLLAEVVVRR